MWKRRKLMKKCIRMMRMRENIQSAPSWMTEERRYREGERWREVKRGRASEQREKNIQNAIVWIVYIVRTWTVITGYRVNVFLSFDTFQSYSNLFQNVLIGTRVHARWPVLYLCTYICMYVFVCVRRLIHTQHVSNTHTSKRSQIQLNTFRHRGWNNTQHSIIKVASMFSI